MESLTSNQSRHQHPTYFEIQMAPCKCLLDYWGRGCLNSSTENSLARAITQTSHAWSSSVSGTEDDVPAPKVWGFFNSDSMGSMGSLNRKSATKHGFRQREVAPKHKSRHEGGVDVYICKNSEPAKKRRPSARPFAKASSAQVATR